ncbi:MAG: hypothetical protein JNJ80_15145 [Gemmatimonadetes bacterium]|nr:hypothetical protein [Gemmatimonadota bacterium]
MGDNLYTSLFLAAAMSCLGVATPLGAAQTGLLVVAHGANPEWNARVRQTVAQVNWPAGPVTTAFLMGPEAESAGFGAAMAQLLAAGVRSVVVVPLMVSSAGSHFRQIRYYAGELGSLPPELEAHRHFTPPDRWPIPVRTTPALDGAPEMAEILRELWAELPEADRRRPLMFVAHGPSDRADAATWVEDLDRAARPTAEHARVPRAIGLILDDAAPSIRQEAVGGIRREIERLAAAAGDSVVVLSLVISRGTLNTVRIPADLANLPIRYVPASLAPSARLARWIERVGHERVSASSP